MYCPAEIILAVNKENVLTDYISERTDYLNIAKPEVDKLIERFSLLGVSFVRLNYQNSEKTLFEAVYRYGLYELNYNNIEEILRFKYEFLKDEDIRQQTYTSILSKKDSSLYEKVKANMSEYIDIVLDNCDENITDKEYAAEEILNCMTLSVEQKQRYIEYLSTKITELHRIEDKSIWKKLLEKNVMYSEQNIMTYFLEQHKMSEELVDFINSGAKKLDFTCIIEEFDKEKVQKLFEETISCVSITDLKYIRILSTLGFRPEQFNIEGIAEEKMRLLIQEKIVPMNSDNLKYIRNKYPDVVMSFIERNLQKYVDDMNGELFSQNELEEILKWNIDDSIKLKLLEYSKQKISVIGKSYSENVCIYILQNKLDEDDMLKLFKDYENQSEKIKGCVREYAERNINLLKSNTSEINRSLLEKIMYSNSVAITDKIDLFIAKLSQMNKATILKYLEVLGLNEFLTIFEPRRKVVVQINEQNKKILQAFCDQGKISSFVEDENNKGFYKIEKKLLL